MRGRDDGQNASIDDTQLLRAVNQKLRVDHAPKFLWHHRITAARVTEGRRERTAGDQLLDRLFQRSILGTGLDFDRLERSSGFAVH